MEERKRDSRTGAGWTVGSTEVFLGLSDEEAAYVEIKLALSAGVRHRRMELGVTQAQLARRMGSSQSRVAKMEAADPSVSIDLLVRAMLAAGATRREIGEVIAAARRPAGEPPA